MPPRPRYVAEIAVRRPEDRPNMGCRVGYQAAPQNNQLTQQQINAQTVTAEWNILVRATLELLYDIKSMEPYDHDGVRGVIVTAWIKPRGQLPPEALDVRNFVVMLETPQGRTNVVCVAMKDSFDARRAEFDQIVRAVTLPR